MSDRALWVRVLVCGVLVSGGCDPVDPNIDDPIDAAMADTAEEIITDLPTEEGDVAPGDNPDPAEVGSDILQAPDQEATGFECLDPDPASKEGHLAWELKTGGPITSGPAIGPDGTIYVGSNDFNLYAVNPDGTVKWTFATGNWVSSTHLYPSPPATAGHCIVGSSASRSDRGQLPQEADSAAARPRRIPADKFVRTARFMCIPPECNSLHPDLPSSISALQAVWPTRPVHSQLLAILESTAFFEFEG